MNTYRRRGAALAGMLGLAGALLAIPPATAAAAPLAWAACPADVVLTPLAPVQCATVPVPLDYAAPGGTQIEIMVSRVAGTRPEKRRGVLMFNPGGPGGSGLGFPADLVVKGLPAGVQDAYDLIGMDTRGIGHSAPVSCGFTSGESYYNNIAPYAVDDAAVTERAGITEAVAEKCAANDKHGRLRHVSTANMARDLDRIRIALGEEGKRPPRLSGSGPFTR